MVQSNQDASINGRTLRDLLALTPKDLSLHMDNKVLLKASEGDNDQLAQWVARDQAPHLSDQVAEHICDALNDNLAGVFEGAWAKFSELKKCAQETRDDPKATMDVTLADHEFTYGFDYSVDVLLNGKKVTSIPFSFSADFTVSGLELSLKQGCVYQVRTGKLDCDAEIRCAQTVVWTRKLEGVDLPGELHLAKPIALDL
jgi:hypothetical protein